jgi:M6 family metalloprotease-like protein
MNRINLVLMVAVALSPLVAIPASAAGAAETTSLTGVVGILWGDSPQDALPPRVDLYDADGVDYLLNLDPSVAEAAGGLLALNGAQVTVEGAFDAAALDQNGNPSFTAFQVTPLAAGEAVATLTGSKPWVILMCRFADYNAEPRQQGYFQGLWGSSFPGINDFWQRNSYGQVNLDGTTVMPSWVRLPYARSHYGGSGAFNLQALTNDCAAKADNTFGINFAQFTGVSMMFNAELDGYAWGGNIYLNRDGVGLIRAAWTPPWAFENQNTLAHEVGHGLGLPHSSGPYSQTYDSPWDVMSAWPPCDADHNRTYGCIGVETISYHRSILGWIPSSKIYTATVGTSRQITLERLGQPTNSNGSYLMAKIPIPGSSTRFYTVEARRQDIDGIVYNDYEEQLIASAVVIHLVDTTRADRIAQVADGSNNGVTADGGSIWAVGETFRNSNAGISVTVLSATSTGYVVEIRDGRVANDNFGSATAVSAYPYSRTESTETASPESADPVFPCASTKGSATVWFKFTPNNPGVVNLSTVGSNYDTLLGIWRGSWGSLTNVACDDNGGGNGASALSANLAANTAYYIEVAGRGAGGTLNFNLGFTPCFRLRKSVSPSGTGTVSANPTPNCQGSYYLNGTSVQLTANPASGKVFSNWGGALSGTRNPATVVMNGAKSVRANFLPLAPTLISPVGGVTVNTLRPMLDWSDVPTSTYEVQLSRSSTFSSPLTYSTTSSYKRLSTDLARNITFYWRVRSNQNGVYSRWSATGNFVSADPPSTPSLLRPANGSTLTSPPPIFDWSDSTNYPAGYQIQVAATSNFGTILIDTTIQSSAYQPSISLPAGTLYWRVRAYNARGQFSNWSTTFRFYT